MEIQWKKRMKIEKEWKKEEWILKKKSNDKAKRWERKRIQTELRKIEWSLKKMKQWRSFKKNKIMFKQR